MLNDDVLKGIRMAGEMMAELVKTLTAAGLEREEALWIAKEWFVTAMSQVKKPGDPLVEYMKAMKTVPEKKQ